jgi:hypothetical protein
VSTTECVAVTGALRNSDGSVAARDKDHPILTETRFLRTASGWRVEDWWVGGDQPCTA